jgi:hypothetical protein
MANDPVVSVGVVVWQLVTAIETAAANATGAKRRINSAALGHPEEEEVISASSGPHDAWAIKC